ncbi:SpoVA/SpoVAEb family sporulation membrane protein [Evansella halocellulosilytica]|uniref:SpoVA/SpoVAEb family sporulation membrane protein n=1 Tax=Evansella halocellulosilytica TaxID=2011013 RepID=UPI000BB7F497|nr:SpoVA/SpoVAEb family sporulation membrane protein [Evansella halocellulosilytica]
MSYVYSFVVGGMICLLGQVLIEWLNWSTVRLLTMFCLLGVILHLLNLYEIIIHFAGAGATVTVIGLGYYFAKGAIEGAVNGFFDLYAGVFKYSAVVIMTCMVIAWITAFVFKAKE